MIGAAAGGGGGMVTLLVDVEMSLEEIAVLVIVVELIAICGVRVASFILALVMAILLAVKMEAAWVVIESSCVMMD